MYKILFLLIGVIIGVLLLFILNKIQKPNETNIKTDNNEENNDQEDIEVTKFPYKKKYLLTKNEYYFYNKLKERLADLIEVDKNQVGSEWGKYFAKIKAKHIDFAITDNMKVILLLELDDSSHQMDKIKERDSFVNNALLNAGYTVIRTNGNLNIIQKALIDKGYHINLYTNTIK